MLTESLPGTPFCGCGSAADASAPSEPLELPSDDVLQSLHEERLRQARNLMLLTGLGVPVAIGVALIVALTPFGVICFASMAVTFLAGFKDALVDWRRVSRASPHESWLFEQRQGVEDFSAMKEYLARVESTRAIASYSIATLVALVTTIQFATGLDSSVPAAALVKPAVWAGEWWRLVTGSFVHSGLIHLLGNLSALVLFGTIIEAFDRRMRVPLVYLAGVLGGSVASALLVAGTSVGASGGVLALLGYVAASGIGPASSEWMRKRMLANIGTIALVGAIGYLFIDNAAHFGGALTGAALGLMSVRAARTSDRFVHAIDSCGWVSAALLAFGAVFTVGRLLHTW